jgi:very-short-patch-repair endonuclease
VVSLPQLRAAGLTQKQILNRVRRGWLHRLHRGVYAVGHPNVPLTGRFIAAVMASGPDAVLSHYAAAAFWGIVDWEDRWIDVTVRGAPRSHRGVRVHRSRTLMRKDVVRRNGIWVTSPARTLVDLASVLDYRSLRRAVRRAQSLRRVNVRQLVEAIHEAGSRRGVRNLAALVAIGPAPTRSELEDVVLDLILRAGLEHPEVNEPLVLDGRRVIPDFRWPAHRLVVEADSAEWHDHRLAREDDAERQALLEAHGERVVRVTWRQAVTLPAQTVARLRAADAPLNAECRVNARRGR